MAYSIDNPPALATQRVGANGGAVWIYKDGDSVSTVCGVNYVSNATDLGLKAGDAVIHIDETTGATTMLTASNQRTSGTASGALCSAIEPIGETSIALQSAGTGTVLVDDIVTFDNDPDGNEYRITTGDADISGGGTLVITPGLVVATAVGTGISIKSDVVTMSAERVGRAVHSSMPATYDILPEQSGDLFLFDKADGIVYTLPVGKVGMKFEFMTTVSLTSNAYSVVTNTTTAGDFLVGYVSGDIEAAATGETHFANGTTHLGISSNATTTGGLIGSTYTVECIAANLWQIKGVVSCTATPATPFTT